MKCGWQIKLLEFIKINPRVKVLDLETLEGTFFESNSIASYVPRLKGDNMLFISSLIDNPHVE